MVMIRREKHYEKNWLYIAFFFPGIKREMSDVVKKLN